MSASSWLRLGGVAVLAALLIGFSWPGGLAPLLDPEQIGRDLAAAGSLAPVVFMGIMAAAVVISPIPSAPLDAAAGAYFGAAAGTLYAALGALLGSMIAFGISRLLGRALIERLLRTHIDFCRDCSDRLLVRVVFVARLLPFVSFDLISYGAGLTNMSLSRFALATFFGMLPITFVYVYFGSVLAFGTTTVLVLGAGMVALFFLLPRLIERHDLFGLRRYFAAHLEAEGPPRRDR